MLATLEQKHAYPKLEMLYIGQQLTLKEKILLAIYCIQWLLTKQQQRTTD